MSEIRRVSCFILSVLLDSVPEVYIKFPATLSQFMVGFFYQSPSIIVMFLSQKAICGIIRS